DGQMDHAGHHPEPAVRRQAQARVDFLTPVVKGWSAESAVQITSTGIQVHGGMGFIEETGAAQYLRDARITAIYEGTNGIQAIDLVTRKLPLNGGATVKAYIKELRDIAARVHATNDAAFGASVAKLGSALDDLKRAPDWLLA